MTVDTRIKKINELLIDYSLGDFHRKIELASQSDEIDSFISSINMLGEELRSSTVSKNYFNNIFNSVTDMLFVLDEKGNIVEANKSVLTRLDKKLCAQLTKLCIDKFLIGQQPSFFKFIKDRLNKSSKSFETEVDFDGLQGKEIIPLRCTINYLYNDKSEKIGYLINAKDISRIKAFENSLKKSEEKYRRIFEETTDTIFLMDLKGQFSEMNRAGLNLFKYDGLDATNIGFKQIFDVVEDHKKILLLLKKNGVVEDYQATLKDKYNNNLECLISINRIESNAHNIIIYQGIIKNISKQKETENLIIRTIVNTQEQERIRFAKDIHDSLGQQLSAMKFYLSVLNSADNKILPKYKSILSKSNDALAGLLTDMRNICFNLMPKALEHHGLKEAILELSDKIKLSGLLTFNISVQKKFPSLDKEAEIAIFRIVQEFINNSIKHGKAKKINIALKYDLMEVRILLKDNGKGFDLKELDSFTGMGLKNVKSRVKSYGGTIKIESALKKGTVYDMRFPISKDAKNIKFANKKTTNTK